MKAMSRGAAVALVAITTMSLVTPAYAQGDAQPELDPTAVINKLVDSQQDESSPVSGFTDEELVKATNDQQELIRVLKSNADAVDQLNKAVEKMEKEKNNANPTLQSVNPNIKNSNANKVSGVKKGDTLIANNFRYDSFPLVCYHGLSCLAKPTVEFTVVDVVKTKQGERVTLNGFAGYKGAPLFNKNGEVVLYVAGSNSGKTFAFAGMSRDEVKELIGPKDASGMNIPERVAGSSSNDAGTGSSNRGGFLAIIRDILLTLLRHIGITISGSANNARTAEEHTKNDAVIEEAFIKSAPAFKNVKAPNSKGKLIESVEWVPSQGKFIVNPTGSIRNASEDKIIEEALALGLVNSESVKQQLICHVRGSFIKQEGWLLEMGRPALANQAEQAKVLCNPNFVR